MNNNGILYHYTNIDSFFNIIKNKTLWCSPASSLNDSKELIWAFDKVRELIEERKNEQNKKMFEKLLEEMKANDSAYICSLSKNGDLLSQWRAYANDGYGVALGFDTECFNPNRFDTDKEETLGLTLENIHKQAKKNLLDDIVYDDTKQTQKLNDILDKFEKQSEKHHYNWSSLCTQIFVNQLSFFFKNPAFSEEDEMRVVYTFTREYGLNPFTIKYRVSRNKITSYIEHEFTCDHLKEVVLGPKSQLDEKELEHFLSTHDFKNIEIKHSSATYR